MKTTMCDGRWYEWWMRGRRSGGRMINSKHQQLQLQWQRRSRSLVHEVIMSVSYTNVGLDVKFNDVNVNLSVIQPLNYLDGCRRPEAVLTFTEALSLWSHYHLSSHSHHRHRYNCSLPTCPLNNLPDKQVRLTANRHRLGQSIMLQS